MSPCPRHPVCMAGTKDRSLRWGPDALESVDTLASPGLAAAEGTHAAHSSASPAARWMGSTSSLVMSAKSAAIRFVPPAGRPFPSLGPRSPSLGSCPSQRTPVCLRTRTLQTSSSSFWRANCPSDATRRADALGNPPELPLFQLLQSGP